MRVRIPGFGGADLSRLFGADLEAQRPQRAQPPPPVQRRFQFSDGFETANNGAQQWLVRRELMQAQPSQVRGDAVRAQPTQASERSTRTLFADGFERSRVAPVDLGQQRSSVNRFQQAPDQTQAQAQGNGFAASLADLG